MACALMDSLDTDFSFTMIDIGDEEEKSELVVEKEFKEYVMPYSTDILVYNTNDNKKGISKIGFKSDNIFLDVFSPPPEYFSRN